MSAALVVLVVVDSALTRFIGFKNLLEEEDELIEEPCYTALVTITRAILS